MTAQPCDANVITTDANSPLEHSVQNSECGSGATSSLLSASHPEKLISQPSNVPLCGTPRQLCRGFGVSVRWRSRSFRQLPQGHVDPGAARGTSGKTLALILLPRERKVSRDFFFFFTGFSLTLKTSGK